MGLEDVVTGSPAAPVSTPRGAGGVGHLRRDPRDLGVRAHGREPDSDHYRYKLKWLGALRDMVAAGPDAAVVAGDMNIAPADADVFDPEAYVGETHVTPPSARPWRSCSPSACTTCP